MSIEGNQNESYNSNLLPRKIVIVGGVAGGMSAAARARRLSEDSEIIVLEKEADTYPMQTVACHTSWEEISNRKTSL